MRHRRRLAAGLLGARPSFADVPDLTLRANDIPDAFLAATAIDLGARLATFDQGFRRFPGLTVIVASAR